MLVSALFVRRLVIELFQFQTPCCIVALLTRARVQLVVATTTFVKGREQIFAQRHNGWLKHPCLCVKVTIFVHPFK